MDETPIQTLREPDKPAASQSCTWLQCSAEQNHPVCFMIIHPRAVVRCLKPY
ncbi:MAG: hypothetical protein ISR69_01425 [Gammaproteobacteria bacterium]|nr:hypothetical protein [Gammaproteobacteria bacterium]